MKEKLSRTQRKRDDIRKKIKLVAGKHFAESGITSTHLDKIAEEVDIARGTLYSHFSNKDELVKAILMDLLQEAVVAIESINSDNSIQALEDLLVIYIKLWKNHPYAWKMTLQVKENDLGSLSEYHQRVMTAIIKIFELLNKDKILRTGKPELSAYIFYVVSMNLMEIHNKQFPKGEKIFIESVKGLLIL